MKRKYVYFIERTDTNEWLYIKETWEQGNTVHEGTTWLTLEWTNDPFLARQFQDKEQAEGEIKFGMKSSELKEFKDTLEITEHEFVITPNRS